MLLSPRVSSTYKACVLLLQFYPCVLQVFVVLTRLEAAQIILLMTALIQAGSWDIAVSPATPNVTKHLSNLKVCTVQVSDNCIHCIMQVTLTFDKQNLSSFLLWVIDGFFFAPQIEWGQNAMRQILYQMQFSIIQTSWTHAYRVISLLLWSTCIKLCSIFSKIVPQNVSC